MNQKELWIEEILEQMTLEEKVTMIHGGGLFKTGAVERLGIPSLVMSDGPIGVREEFDNQRWIPVNQTFDKISYFPCGSALAATFDPELAKLNGKMLGEEARGRGKDVILAPSINIKRTPLCGRNFEYFSEDPKLTEEMCVPFIEGVQENDVAACAKHFAANVQETDRMKVDTIVDDEVLNEIYFKAFYAAVKRADVYSVMGAYNRLNGEQCCTSRKLLDGVLREKWGFDGTVISDWGGVHDTDEAALSSLDIEMDVIPDFENHYMADRLIQKIQNGEIKESCVDKKVRNILRMMKRLKMIGPEKEERKAGIFSTSEHHQAALSIARDSVVLLKNEENRLPIQKKGLKKIAVIGENAIRIHSSKGGSSELKALYEKTPLLGICQQLGGNTEVLYAKGYDVPDNLEDDIQENWQARSTQEVDITKIRKKADTEKEDVLLKEAVELAKSCDQVIFVGGLNHAYDLEGMDRVDLKLPYNQDRLIEAVLDVNPETVIVLTAGSPVGMPWADRAKAIVFYYYAGMESGQAVAEVLFGAVNPSGKLPETFPKKIEDCLAVKLGEMGKTDRIELKEKLLVGYRQYDTEQTDVQFCFGHGLSYTEFKYNNMNVIVKPNCDKIEIEIALSVKNTGKVSGKESVQIYVRPAELKPGRPVHELQGFQKVELRPGEEKEVHIILDEKAISHYKTETGNFEKESGRYIIEAGASSRNIKLTREIVV